MVRLLFLAVFRTIKVLKEKVREAKLVSSGKKCANLGLFNNDSSTYVEPCDGLYK